MNNLEDLLNQLARSWGVSFIKTAMDEGTCLPKKVPGSAASAGPGSSHFEGHCLEHSQYFLRRVGLSCLLPNR